MSKNAPRSLHSRKANGIKILQSPTAPSSRAQTPSLRERSYPSRRKTISAIKADNKPQPAPIPSYITRERRKEQKNEKERIQTPQSYLNDPDCISLREQLMDDSDVSNIETERLNHLLFHLREYSAFCAENRQYDDAQIANLMLEYINKEISIRESHVVVDRTIEDNYEQEADELLQKHEAEEAGLREKFDARRTILNKNLEEERAKFEEEWKTEMPLKYRKASTALLDLMDKEKRLAKSGKFEEAKEVKKLVDSQEEREMAQQQRLMINDYKKAKRKLDEKQSKRLDLFERTFLHNLDCLIARQKIELNHLDNRMNVVNKIQEEKVKEVVKVVPHVHISTSEGPQRERVLPPLIAPNDTERIAEFEKKEAEKKKKPKSQEVKRPQTSVAKESREFNDSNDFEETFSDDDNAKVAEEQNEDESTLFLTKSRAEPEGMKEEEVQVTSCIKDTLESSDL